MPEQLIPERIKASVKRNYGLDVNDPYAMAEAIAKNVCFSQDKHDRFRSWIMRVNPEQRVGWYDLLCAHVKSFMQPKPLADYVMLQNQKAEAEQLPTGIDDKGNVVGFKPARSAMTAQEKLARSAEKAIRQSYEEEQKGRLSLTCAKCTAMDLFYAQDRPAAVEKARLSGWLIGEEKAYCPKCWSLDSSTPPGNA